jgi:hypothetical protein
MQLDRQQLSAANTLDNVLKELNVKAKAGTKSNDYIQAVELCKQHKVPVILPDRGIIFYYPKHGLDRNYLSWPADSLQPLHTDSNFDYLVDVLCRVFEEQDRNGVDRDPNVVVGFKVRAEPEINQEGSQVHPEVFEEHPQGGAAPSDCTLRSWWDETGRDTTTRPAGALTDAQKQDLRAELKAVVENRQAAAGGTERPRYKFEADHLFSCWLITCLLMQFFGTRNLDDLSPADKLWLITAVKKLHNGVKNTMMVDTCATSGISGSICCLRWAAPWTTSAPGGLVW